MASQSKEIQRLQLEMDQISRTKSIFNSNQVQKIFNSTASGLIPEASQGRRPVDLREDFLRPQGARWHLRLRLGL